MRVMVLVKATGVSEQEAASPEGSKKINPTPYSFWPCRRVA